VAIGQSKLGGVWWSQIYECVCVCVCVCVDLPWTTFCKSEEVGESLFPGILCLVLMCIFMLLLIQVERLPASSNSVSERVRATSHTSQEPWPWNCTSRKHGIKESQSFVHCGSFDDPDLHLLNDYKVDLFVFWFTNWSFRNLGAFNIPLERSWKHLSNGVLHAPKKFKIVIVK
jgi:hypothetical protein